MDKSLKQITLYKCKQNKIAGSSFNEIKSSAYGIFKSIKSKTKRTPYIRSKYFKKDKIFINIFWKHLFDKKEKDRVRRLKFYNCGIELIEKSVNNPETRENFQKKDELLHRFYGRVRNNEKFVVQIKENKRTKRKDLISIYPIK